MADRQVAESAVESREHARAFDPHVGAEPGLGEPEVEHQVVEHVVPEIDRSLGFAVDRTRTDGEIARKHAVLQRAERSERDRAVEHLGGLPGQRRCRGRLPDDAVAPVAVGEAEGGEALALALDEQRPAPAAPGAIALDQRAVSGVGADQAGDHPLLRREVVEIDVEPVAVRLRVDQQMQPVALAQGAVGREEHAPVADIGLGREIDPVLAIVDHSARDPEVVELQPVHADVEVGQDRRVGITGKQLGRAQQGAAPGREIAHVEPAPQPVERAPVELRHRHREEGPLGVGQGNVVQGRAAVDVAFDPADRDPQAGGRCHLGDAVHDEALPDRAVEHHEREQHDRRETGDDPRGPPAQADDPRAAAARRHGLLGGRDALVFRHQKACPSET